MTFAGPGLYEIVLYQAPTKCLNSWGGTKDVGEVVKSFGRDNPALPTYNSVWQVALANSAFGEPAQYFIINGHNGYFLTATAAGTIVSSQQRSPSDKSVRWFIKESPGNKGVFYINSVSPDLGQLNVSYASTESGASILAWPISNEDNTKFYFVPVAISN